MVCRQAQEVRTRLAMPVEWAECMINLANAYYYRIRGDRTENLEQDIVACRYALEVMTRQAMPVAWATVMTNLANAYYYRILGDRTENLEQAIAAYSQALEVMTPDGLPDDCRRAARSLTNLFFAEARYAEVIEPYELVIQANENLLQASLMRGSKEVELGEIQDLPARAAYALARLDRLEEAVEALEAGRARLLAEAFEGNRRDLEQLEPLGHGDLLARYRAAAERLAALHAQVGQSSSGQAAGTAPQRDFATLTQEIQAARGELDAAIAAIRQIPGYEDFFLPPTFEKIRQAAGPDAPLVYLVVTSAGGLALVADRQTFEVSGQPEVGTTSKVSACGWTASPSQGCASESTVRPTTRRWAATSAGTTVGGVPARPGGLGCVAGRAGRDDALAVGRGHGAGGAHLLPCTLPKRS